MSAPLISMLRHGRRSSTQFAYPPATLLSKVILGILVFTESVVSVFWIYTLSGLGEAYLYMVAAPYLYIVVSYTSLLIFYRSKRYEYFTFIQLLLLLVMPFFMQWVIGGLEASGGIAVWAILSPVGALLIIGYRQSLPWFALFVLLVGISWQLNSAFEMNVLPIPTHLKSVYFALNVLGTAVILYSIMSFFQSQKELAMASLDAERKKSDKLLLNILPESIANKLRNKDFNIAEEHAAATIMFVDMVNFTRISSGMTAPASVDMLNQVFTKFDDLTKKYGLEKIKTIGDAYMVAGGVPEVRADHAEAIIKMALEIQGVLAEVSASTGKDIQMRIGINSGPVIAGVIGHSKFSYDLWGNTVNLASRMEQYGLPGKIQVSEATYLLLKNKYKFEMRDEIELMGKVKVRPYVLKGAIST